MFRTIASCILALFLSLAVLAASASAGTVEEGVSTAFANFKQALAARNGAAAANYIDDRTAAFYEKIRRAALRMPKNQLLKEPLFFQIEVFSTRLSFSKAEIEKTDGRGVYTKLAAAGETAALDAFNSLTLIKIQPTRAGASAIAHVSLAGRPGSVPLRFFTQGGVWKIDLIPLLKTATDELQEQIGVTRRTPTETVEKIIERDFFPIMTQQSGKPVTEKVWVPLANAK